MAAIAVKAEESSSDTYEPLVQEGYEWGYVRVFGWEPWNEDQHYYYRLQFYGDTIASGITYKKLYQYRSDKLNPDAQLPIAFMREENKKVYTYLPHYTDEYLEHLDQEFMDDLSDHMIGRFGHMDNLMYDFSADISDDFIAANYDWFNEKLRHIDWEEFSTGSRLIYYSSSWNEAPLENCNRTAVGVGVLYKAPNGGFLPFPNWSEITGTCRAGHMLLYKRRLDDGSLCFKDDALSKFMVKDPTLQTDTEGLNPTDGCSDVWVEYGLLHGAVECTVTNASGMILHCGVAEGYRFPASGIYFVTHSDKVAKFAVTI